MITCYGTLKLILYLVLKSHEVGFSIAINVMNKSASINEFEFEIQMRSIGHQQLM